MSNREFLESDSRAIEAAQLVVTHGQASVSLLLRRLQIDYNRAAKIIELLENVGIVGPFSGNSIRAVLIKDGHDLENLLDAEK